MENFVRSFLNQEEFGIDELQSRLHAMTRLGSRHTQYSAASHELTLLEDFQFLAENGDNEVLRRLALNSAVPSELVPVMLANKRIDHLGIAGLHPGFPIEKIVALHRQGSLTGDMLRYNPVIPVEILLRELEESKSTSLQYMILQNPSFPLSEKMKIVHRFLNSSSTEDDEKLADLVGGIASNTALPAWMLLALVSKPMTLPILSAIAKNPEAPAPVLRAISTLLTSDGDFVSLIRNPNTPIDTCEDVLAMRKSLSRRSLLTTHSSTELIEEFVNEEKVPLSYPTVSILACMPQVTNAQLERMWDIRSCWVQSPESTLILGANGNASGDLIDRILNEKNIPSLRQSRDEKTIVPKLPYIAHCWAASSQAFLRLINIQSSAVDMEIARNPKTPIALLDLITETRSERRVLEYATMNARLRRIFDH